MDTQAVNMTCPPGSVAVSQKHPSSGVVSAVCLVAGDTKVSSADAAASVCARTIPGGQVAHVSHL